MIFTWNQPCYHESPLDCVAGLCNGVHLAFKNEDSMGNYLSDGKLHVKLGVPHDHFQLKELLGPDLHLSTAVDQERCKRLRMGTDRTCKVLHLRPAKWNISGDPTEWIGQRCSK